MNCSYFFIKFIFRILEKVNNDLLDSNRNNKSNLSDVNMIIEYELEKITRNDFDQNMKLQNETKLQLTTGSPNSPLIDDYMGNVLRLIKSIPTRL